MSRDYPDWIQAERAAQARRSFAGSMPLSRLKRVQDVLLEPELDDAIGFEASFWRDDQGNLRLDCMLNGRVPLRCQRTLKRYLQAIDSKSSLAVIESEAELSALPDDLEPKICPDGRLNIAELVEDELLLALPLVPVDPNTEPMIQAGDVFEAEADQHVNQRSNKPFAGLADALNKTN
ncbi:MAG: YceD family protein [Pseudomonadota bacterium]